MPLWALAVRGSPDPARRLTVGLPEQRFAPIQGDLRSRPRRGRETRAEREQRFAPIQGDLRSRPRAGSGDPRRARSPRATICANSGRPSVAPTAGSGDPRQREQRFAPIQGDLRSRPRRGRETRAEREQRSAQFRETFGRATAGSGDPRRAQRFAPIQGDLRSRPRRGRETRAARNDLRQFREAFGRAHGGVGRPAPRGTNQGITVVFISRYALASGSRPNRGLTPSG